MLVNDNTAECGL